MDDAQELTPPTSPTRLLPAIPERSAAASPPRLTVSPPTDSSHSPDSSPRPFPSISLVPPRSSSSTQPEPADMASGRPHDANAYHPNGSSASLDHHHGVPGVLPSPSPNDPSAYPPPHLSGGRRGVHSTASSDYGDFPPSSSVPSLPRYTSSLGGHSSSDYSSAPGRPTGRPAAGAARGPSSSGGHGGSAPAGAAHPLSNTIYSEANRSQPTGLGSSSADDEKGRRSQSSSRAGGAVRRPPPRGGPLTRAYRAWTGAKLGDSGIDERHVKKKRLGYLDGLKFIAAMLVLNGTLFDAVLTPTSYSAIQRDSPLYIVRSTGLGIVMLLLLSGRSLIAPLWDAPNPNAPAAGGKPADPRKPLISWPRLTRAMLVRPFRFILPVIVVAALQWGLASGGDGRATKNCNAVGMNEPYWGNIGSFAGYVTLVFDLFTVFESDTLAGQAFGGNLWTVPWFFQSSYCVYVTHFMLGNLSSNRWWVYGLLIFFSWTSFNFFAVALCGLFIADLAAHGYTARIRKWPVTRKALLWGVLLAVGLCLQWINPVRDGLNDGLAKINVTRLTEIQFADVILAVCLVFIVETSEVAQALFGNVVMRLLGRLSAGVYLLAPAIVFTAVPDVALSMHNGGSNPSAILGVSWALTFGIVIAVSPFFHLLVECPSKLAGEYFSDFVERFGASSDTSPAMTATHGITQRKNPAAAAGARPAGSQGVNRDAIGAAVKNAGK